MSIPTPRRRAALLFPLALIACEAASDPRIDAAVEEAVAAGTFAGEVVVQHGGKVVHQAAYGDIAPDGDAPHGVGEEWRWASVSKMVTAVLVLKEGIDLDAPVSTVLPDAPDHFARITVRQLLNHTSGLPNPNDEAGARWYADEIDRRAYCSGAPLREPGTEFSYNNCDFLVLSDILEAVTGEPFPALAEMRLKNDLGLSSVRVVTDLEDDAEIGGYAEGALMDRGFHLSTFGAGGALVGRPADLVAFNHTVMDGSVLGQAALEEFATGVPELGYVALGAWAYEATPPGCAGPLRLVERRGDIEGVHVLTILSMDQDRSFAAFSNRAGTDWGWIWAGEGLAADLASAAFCDG